MYTDGFVLPVPKKNLKAYVKMSKQAGKIWKKYGALDYKECVLDDPKADFAVSFPKGISVKARETVVFSWIVYKSRAHRNKVNAQVMKDPAMGNFDPAKMPFDCSRMLYGGFKVMISL